VSRSAYQPASTGRLTVEGSNLDGMAPESQEVTIVNNVAQSRYELRVGDQVVGLADYYLQPGDLETVVIPHTETLPEFQGQGLAARLIAFALADVAAAGRKVRPDCPYVAGYIQRHPEYAGRVS
jgi:predicted GNAT family acetyltransferase